MDEIRYSRLYMYFSVISLPNTCNQELPAQKLSPLMHWPMIFNLTYLAEFDWLIELTADQTSDRLRSRWNFLLQFISMHSSIQHMATYHTHALSVVIWIDHPSSHLLNNHNNNVCNNASKKEWVSFATWYLFIYLLCQKALLTFLWSGMLWWLWWFDSHYDDMGHLEQVQQACLFASSMSS